MAIVLGLLAALSWGTGDFAGGMATRRTAESAVVLGAQVVGLVLLLVIAPFGGGSPHASDLGLGALAGLMGVVGIALLYRGLRTSGSYRPQPGWASFIGKILLALLALGGLLYWGVGSTADWLSMPNGERLLRLSALVAGGASIYFTALALLGFRLADFKKRAN